MERPCRVSVSRQPSADGLKPEAWAGATRAAPRWLAHRRSQTSNRCDPGASPDRPDHEYCQPTPIPARPRGFARHNREHGPGSGSPATSPMSRNSRRAAAGRDSPMRATGRAPPSMATRSTSSVRWNGASISAVTAPDGPAPTITTSAVSSIATGSVGSSTMQTTGAVGEPCQWWTGRSRPCRRPRSFSIAMRPPMGLWRSSTSTIVGKLPSTGPGRLSTTPIWSKCAIMLLIWVT